MKSSKASTLKGLPNQIIKQIIKISLPSDVVQLQPGRKPKKGARKPTKRGAPQRKKPVGTDRRKKEPTYRLPKAPEGVLSHTTSGAPPAPPAYPSVFGDNQPRPFAQPTFQPPSTTPFEKMFYEKLAQFKTTPGMPTPDQPTKPTQPAPSPIAPVVQPSMSLKEAMQPRPIMIPQPSPVISRLPARGSVAERYVRSRSREIELGQGRVPGFRVPESFWGISSPIVAEEVPRPPPLRGAPNQANQPSVDVTVEEKEVAKPQPQVPAVSLAQSSQPRGLDISKLNIKRQAIDDSPMASQASSSSLTVESLEETRDARKRKLRLALSVLRKTRISARDPDYERKTVENEAKIQAIRDELEELE